MRDFFTFPLAYISCVCGEGVHGDISTYAYDVPRLDSPLCHSPSSPSSFLKKYQQVSSFYFCARMFSHIHLLPMVSTSEHAAREGSVKREGAQGQAEAQHRWCGPWIEVPVGPEAPWYQRN
jgi:hypothetical protein